MLLQADKLKITLLRNGRVLIEDFSFTLKQGDKIAVIGEEGDGKSTLMKVLCGERCVLGYAAYSGTLVRTGRSAYFPQFLPEEKCGKTLYEYFADADVYAHYGVLREMDLCEDLLFSARTLASLSGGERVKARLFRLLCDDPDALFLDEPSNDLDADSLEFLCGFIRTCPVPVVFISHDETLLRRAANGVIHIEQLIKKTKSKVSVSRMGFEEYLSRREEGIARQTQIALNERTEYRKKRETLARLAETARKNTSWKNRDGIPSSDGHAKRFMQAAAAKTKRLERERENMTGLPDREKSIVARFEEDVALPRGKRILDFSVERLTAGENLLARRVALSLVGGEHVGITGKNGAGKSTLLRQIEGALRDKGDLRVGTMPQNYADALDFSLTPSEYLQAHYDKTTQTKAFTLLGNLNFTPEEMRARIGELSGGQQAKLIFLNMVLQKANVLVLDEPTRNFSPLSAPAVRSALRAFGGAIVAVSHDRLFLEEVCGSVYKLDGNGLRRLR